MIAATNRTAEDAKALEYVRSQTNAFKRHLVAKYPADPRTKALLAKFKDIALLESKSSEPSSGSGGSSVYNSGMFSHKTGRMSVAPRDGNGNIRSAGSLNKTIVHELAHATRFKYLGEDAHSDEWKSSWLFFLKIATEELGWDVEASCSAVTYYGLDKNQCPGCNFDVDPESCGGFTGPPQK